MRPRTGFPVEGDIAPLRYRTILSDDFERALRALATWGRTPAVRGRSD
ncbi:hypothetical protein [Streptomyces sp. NEAU-YJ-81]|nr:hypothetical protein [Streptomyces sp. NEAU-YJ-81]